MFQVKISTYEEVVQLINEVGILPRHHLFQIILHFMETLWVSNG